MIRVIGAGLAGCEAAWQIANAGEKVELYEMKPHKKTPAHKSENFGELVCSNSLRAADLTGAPGLLKEEMRRLGSLIMAAADATSVPAGGALAVDRTGFEEYITEKIKSHENIKIIAGEVAELPRGGRTIIATGPLTEGRFFDYIQTRFGLSELYFFDAAAPIATFESIDMETCFFASRYDKNGADYINCPFEREQYLDFYNALVGAETAELHGFENAAVFEGCMPIEVMAARGKDTMRFGPLKPVGLINPKTGKEAYAVCQLRKDDAAGSLYNIVGFQTHLKFSEQKKVFRMIPGLQNAEFVRYGVMHRNTFINSPLYLDNFYRLKTDSSVYFAGQITGVEGYIESASSGLLAGFNAAREEKGQNPVDFTNETAIGALSHYVSAENKKFQPMNINFGIISSTGIRGKGRKGKRQAKASAALSKLSLVAAENGITLKAGKYLAEGE